MMSQLKTLNNTLTEVPTPDSMPNLPNTDPLSMREIFTWEIAAMVSLLLLGMTMQIGSGLLGVAVHHGMDAGAPSNQWVSPNCSEPVVTQ